MNWRMTERIGKSLACLILAPFLMMLMLVLAVLMLSLPFVAFICPDVVKVNKRGSSVEIK